LSHVLPRVRKPTISCRRLTIEDRKPIDYLLATAAHTAAMLAVAGLIAVVVYYKLGLALLRAWFNLDWLWALALVGAGVFAALA
jgi:hypothetical protein